ncbi:MAG: hypothetical protein BGO49_30535 [Planctomycetales bacterium 71-10]|nr:MAG: hypothetical protein BGO49_30535 [Planctomycetales bacterium 71-10]
MKRGRRGGFTLIELLTTTGILSILIALALPAVQSAREAARRSTCLGNLRQIGIALQSYEALHHAFPPALTSQKRHDGADATPGVDYFGKFSFLLRLLPHLEQSPVFAAINFDVGCDFMDGLGTGEPSAPYSGFPQNTTAYTTTLAAFLCPSDGSPPARGAVNYRGCTGEGGEYITSAEFPDSANGVFPIFGRVSSARIPDGLSHTVAVSERLRGSLAAGPSATRDALPLQSLAMTADDFLTACRIAARPDGPPISFTGNGRWWAVTGLGMTLYSQTQPPNGRVPDCLMLAGAAVGMTTARSHHPGGVHALMADGSTRFVLDSIAPPTWRALGTRNGHELAD